MIAILTSEQFQTAKAISALVYCNPFLRARIAYERSLLGSRFDEQFARWNEEIVDGGSNPNLIAVVEMARAIVNDARNRWRGAKRVEWVRAYEANWDQACAFEDTLLFLGYHAIRDDIDRLIDSPKRAKADTQAAYQRFETIVREHTGGTPYEKDALEQMPHYFAGFFQLRRAFKNIFGLIIGRADATIRLRAAVFESIFTHDMRRYRTHLFRHMTDFTTLITGPSGTGKELVAKAIGLSRYIPFDAKTGQFADHADASFFPINLAALSPTLIESELFGHAKGAFTGAVESRVGWFETCPTTGSVFLDEIGELDTAIQVKLLRVLQQREFSRLGESELRAFHGKVICATNRDLASGIREGRFREDLYYRLCSDRVEVPSLRERLDQDPAELTDLITIMSARILGGDTGMAEPIRDAILKSVGEAYEWPGNVRELEQAIRNVLIRGRYVPMAIPAADDPYESVVKKMKSAAITADDLISIYCRLDYEKTGSYEKTGERLNLDRRTVRGKVKAEI